MAVAIPQLLLEVHTTLDLFREDFTYLDIGTSGRLNFCFQLRHTSILFRPPPLVGLMACNKWCEQVP